MARNQDNVQRERDDILKEFDKLTKVKAKAPVTIRGRMRNVERSLTIQQIYELLAEQFYKSPRTIEDIIARHRQHPDA